MIGIPTPLKNDGVSEFVSWDDDIPSPTVSGKSFKIPWFQSPPKKERMIWGKKLHSAILVSTIENMMDCSNI